MLDEAEWEFQAGLLDDATSLEWLSLAYGDDEAAQAMGLPKDVRVSLYRTVLMLGPAGEEVTVFLQEVGKALDSDYFNGRCGFSESLGELADLATVQGAVLHGMSLSEWSRNSEKAHRSLDMVNIACRHTSGEVAGMSESSIDGATVLAWLLNGQYLFDADEVVVGSELANRANEVLEVLGLPTLGGAFVRDLLKA